MSATFAPMTLTPEQWGHVKEIVADALEISSAERGSFVQQACHGDQLLLEEVRSLLAFQRTIPYSDGESGLIPGTLLKGRYLIERALAQGGFSTAWIALDRQLLNRRVVVKLLSGSTTDPYLQRKFADELSALATLEHPNIIAPLDNGHTSDGTPYLVTQFAEGETLGSILANGPLPLQRTARILSQIGHTLSFIHDAGIVHRDLKPENIIIQTFANADHVRLIDFGIATVGYIGAPRSTQIIGSLAYMAPEQLAGQVGPATDLYALGTIAYELITGTLPFHARSPHELVTLQSRGTITRPAQLRRELSAEAEALILEALQSDPSRRPANISIFVDRLATALQSTAGTPRRFPRPVISISAATVLILIGALPFMRFPMQSRAPVKTAPQAMTSGVTRPDPVATLELYRRSPAAVLSPGLAGRFTLHYGDEFRVVLHNNAAGYLYLFSESAGDTSLHVLFPSPTTNRASSRLDHNQSIEIPERSWFKVTNARPNPQAAENEVLDIVWSPTPISDGEAAMRFANPEDRGVIQDGPERRAIRTLLSRNAQPIRFEGPRGELYSSLQSALTVGRIFIDHFEKIQTQFVAR